MLYLGEALKILPLELLPSSILPSGWAKTSPSCARKERPGRRRLTLLPIESPGYRNLRHDSSAMKRDTHLNVIGPEIRRIRKQRGWSQSKLELHLQSVGWNISRSGLAKIECRIMWVGDFRVALLGAGAWCRDRKAFSTGKRAAPGAYARRKVLPHLKATKMENPVVNTPVADNAPERLAYSIHEAAALFGRRLL
jgi:hypothetical protein